MYIDKIHTYGGYGRDMINIHTYIHSVNGNSDCVVDKLNKRRL